jgi:UDP:flavonoid glycosyltransferase YjiC (YdhE family)
VLAVPHAGDMHENAARLCWIGAGRRLPWPLLSAPTLRHAVRRALADPGLAERAGQLGAWAATHDGAKRAADLVEELSVRRSGGR